VKIMFVIRTLCMGGMEHSTVKMANYWAARGCEVSILTLADRKVFFQLHPTITLIVADFFELDAPRLRRPIAWLRDRKRRISKLRSILRSEKPDVIIACWGDSNVVAVLASIGLHIPVFVTERTSAGNAVCEPYNTLRHWLYPQAAGVVVLHAAMKQQFSKRIQAKTTVIPNSVVLPDETQEDIDFKKEKAVRPEKWLMAMGRLVELKRFDELMRAFAAVAPRYPSWNLVIWGDGPEKEALEILAVQLGLADRVRLPGETREPIRELRKVDLFALTSRFEGFSNVLCEAIGCGVASVSYNCPCGPDVIIEHEKNGLLVPSGDFEGLKDALSRMMGDDAFRDRCASNGPEILVKYSLESVMDQWARILASKIEHGVATEILFHDGAA